MKPRIQHVVSIFFSLVTAAVLIFLGQTAFIAPDPEPGMWAIFTILVALTSAFGIPLGGGDVSIMPMIALTGALVIGVIPAAWAVVCGDLIYGLARFIWPKQTGWDPDQGLLSLIGTTAVNLSMHGFSVLAAGSIFQHFDGTVPASTASKRLILVGAAVSYILTNYLIASIYLLLRGKAHVVYLWKHFPSMMLYEAIPLIFAPLSAQIFLFQGWAQFIMFAIGLMIISFILRDQANSHKDLQRRLQELDSLQVVGQALSASLDINTIAETIFTEVSKLMPATNFYVALFNQATQEVTFPVVYEHNRRKEWEPRAMGRGLTEYVLETKKPLLIEQNVKEEVLALGLQHRGEEALSWLGVPILAGDKALGIITVQSYHQTGRIEKSFDKSDQEILSTIAAQASVAIQNAQLYAQTDQALALRVQELSSIFRTTHEGILLLNKDLHVVEANKSLANMIDEPLTKVLKMGLDDPGFARCLGFTEDQAIEILNDLAAGNIEIHTATVSIDLEIKKTLQRMISPVVSEDQVISGWLLVFRDITEEIHLSQLREDLTRMLVHDLRSPMVTVQGGLDMIEMMIKSSDSKEDILDMVEISQRGGEQMMGMINELLSIHKYESGQLVLNLEPVILPELINEVMKNFTTITKQVHIQMKTNITQGLPIVVLDRELIRRLVYNLVDNAVKFTGDGGMIETWAKPDPDNPEMILFGVQDNGIGIPAEIQEKLFQKYFSSGEKQSRRKGTGIGLYFSKLAVQAHGGEIWVESELGKGSNFIIRLPIEGKPA